MTFTRVAASTILALFAGRAAAQQSASQGPPTPADLIVKTVPLHHLSSADAVKLLAPYVRSPWGGVFEGPRFGRVVTIKETPKTYAEMMTVLALYDHEPATVTLNFQLIAAENSTTRDPNVAGLDSLLRGVLKFSGYRLLTTSVASASEYGHVSQSLSAEGEPMTLSVDVTDLRVDGNDASVHLTVVLDRDAVAPRPQAPGHGHSQLLSTGVTVPIGQTVVLGTAATDGAQRALILTVRPQLASVKR